MHHMFLSLCTGPWNVTVLNPAVADEGADELFSDSAIDSALTYNFTYDDATEELQSIVYEGDAADLIVVGDATLQVSESDNSTAVWSDASDEADEGAGASVRFELKFERASSSVWVAQGRDSEKKVSYSVVATLPDTFVATETGDDGVTSVTVGQRYHAPQEKSFFQKYGTYGMMGGLFLLNIGMRYFTGQGGMGGAAPAGEEGEGQGEGDAAPAVENSAEPTPSKGGKGKGGKRGKSGKKASGQEKKTQ